MIHKVPEEWLIKLETTLHLATKRGRISNRLDEILAETEIVCQKAFSEPVPDTSTEIKPNFISRIKLKLANRKVD